jgi:hypothetical protein
VISEDPDGPHLTADQPVSFRPGSRTYTGRRTRTTSITTLLETGPTTAPRFDADPYELGG